MSFSMSYRSPPLGSHLKTKSIWEVIVEKVEHRLAGWKRLYISKGAKIG